MDVAGGGGGVATGGILVARWLCREEPPSQERGKRGGIVECNSAVKVI